MPRKTEYDASLDPAWEQESYYHASNRQGCWECGRALAASATAGELCSRCEAEKVEEVYS